ncbi:hypothetical protein OG788_46225 [Streptomyces sp. NBC_00647]|uniref:hypothetical protein n=1 Tax=unclassified Streptomyces TaxID=2593676 RepID=UPI00324707D6
MIVPYVVALADGVFEVAYGRAADVEFFDGQYSVELRPTAGRIQIVPKGVPDFISSEMEYSDLVADVTAAGRLLLDACRQRGWSLDSDVLQLREILERLPQGLS